MTLSDFNNELLALAMEMGCTAAECSCARSDSFSVNIQDGEIEKYRVADSESLSLRVCFEGHDGFASTNVFDEPKTLVIRAIDNAKSVSSVDDHPMQGKSEYEKMSLQRQKICDMTEKERIELAREIERRAKAKDKRVKRVTNANVEVIKASEWLVNTYGLDAQKTTEMGAIVLGIVMEQDGEERNAFSERLGIECMDIDGLVDEAVDNCASLFGASPVEPGEYRVLFTNRAFCDMLSMFSGIFSADAAQKGMSLLAGKEGEVIASQCVTLCDDPHNPIFPTPFDDEGVPTYYKNVIENGRLITLLHSLKTAKKAGVKSTGNGTRSGSCRPSNFYIKAGDKTFEQLIQGERVLVISEVDGAGTGVNAISGEFSLSAKGQLYENGMHIKPVNQITVAGVFFELLKNILDVGNDLVFTNESNMFGSPCVLVDKLVVAG